MLIGILEELEYWKISVTPVSLFSPRPVYLFSCHSTSAVWASIAEEVADRYQHLIDRQQNRWGI